MEATGDATLQARHDELAALPIAPGTEPVSHDTLGDALTALAKVR